MSVRNRRRSPWGIEAPRRWAQPSLASCDAWACAARCRAQLPSRPALVPEDLGSSGFKLPIGKLPIIDYLSCRSASFRVLSPPTSAQLGETLCRRAVAGRRAISTRRAKPGVAGEGTPAGVPRARTWHESRALVFGLSSDERKGCLLLWFIRMCPHEETNHLPCFRGLVVKSCSSHCLASPLVPH